jgi:hypothetical protein
MEKYKLIYGKKSLSLNWEERWGAIDIIANISWRFFGAFSWRFSEETPKQRLFSSIIDRYLLILLKRGGDESSDRIGSENKLK